MSTSCCPSDRAATKPSAERERDGLHHYIVGTGPRGVIVAPDIFGESHFTCFEFCDAIAREGSFTVVLPDFFRGKPWDFRNFPPAGGMEDPEFVAHRARLFQFPAFLQDVATAAQLLRRMRNVTSISIVGLCWGGKVAALAAGVPGLVDASVGIHPSRLEVHDAQNATCPMALILSQGEPPLEEIKDVLATNDFAQQNLFVRFDDLIHGFLGARGPGALSADPSDAVVGRRVKEAFEVTLNFLRRTPEAALSS